MVRIHREPSTRQLINFILERLEHFPSHFLIAVKIIRMVHKTVRLEYIIILKDLIRLNFMGAGGYDSLENNGSE